MDSIPYDSILLLGVLLCLSVYFSAAETAITNVNKVHLRGLVGDNSKRAVRSLQLTDNIEGSTSTLIVGSHIVNIAFAVIATKLAMDMFGHSESVLILSLVGTVFIVITFGVSLPKLFAKRNAEKYLLASSASLTVVMKLFYPITWMFVRLRDRINKLFGSRQKGPTVTEEDVKALVEIGEEEGTFLTQEKELLHNAIEFDDIIARDILTPRPDVVAVALDASKEEIKEVFIQEKFSRLPVYDGSIDQIVGIISHRDFFEKYLQSSSFEIAEIMRRPVFVIATGKISDLLKELQRTKVHLAIVLDEYGGTAGIISIEDILEEIVGEIWDEHDEHERYIEEIKEGKIRLDGRISFEEFCEFIGVELPEKDSNTLGGWITETLGYLPANGEKVTLQHLIFEVEEIGKRRINKVIVEINEEAIQSA